MHTVLTIREGKDADDEEEEDNADQTPPDVILWVALISTNKHSTYVYMIWFTRWSYLLTVMIHSEGYVTFIVYCSGGIISNQPLARGWWILGSG